MSIAAAPTFAPPGPGTWSLDATHFTRPVTRFHAEIFPAEFGRGFGDSLRRYGSLLERLDWAFVNGFSYYCPRPIGAPPDVSGHPPHEVWERMAADDPRIRERLATSAMVFERRLWREDLRRWDSEVKPSLVADHRALLEVEPAALDDAGLLAHLDRCREHQRRACYLHHLFNMPALLPMGDLLAHCQEWTSRTPGEILAPLAGSSPDPLAAGEELARLTAAVTADPEARRLFASSTEPAELLDALCALPAPTGAAAAAYLEQVGWRPVNGEDVGDPCVLEMPGLVVRAIRTTAAGRPSANEGQETETAAELRSAVPLPHRGRFDELLSEARLVSRLRDERGSFADLPAIGLTRRAILAAGRRLARTGRIADPAHLVEADYTELRELVRTGDGPDPGELSDRARYREQARYADAPLLLGPPPGDPLPPQWLPPAAARLEQALGAVVQAMFGNPVARTAGRTVHGLGASPGVYEGTARVIRDVAEFGRLQPGDVLVTNATTTAFNIVLPLLGAIVTDRGGALSHAAIVAREFAIPGVVGCTDATAVLPDGSRVRVDGRAGEAAVVS
ncbi:PEP-utilizing enzyme [Streptomyces sp. RerS4]|uniref:PEP-utilizing enzyme n=1 Tax=Streptomyces sp. RerS4 TaxID=2942449 RepID=UPI00201C62F9|nr:PEP-utilizing enzyme [Streptomyces sp. RerS4]UQX02127.1 PEP-utilizing enzyme [Streptomyces sp. RerS4]